MSFNVSLEQFDGPLDLMLYLIKEHKLDLFNLNLADLADQYMIFLANVQSQKLEVASEYLSELAGLIEYKSKRLLPRDKSELEADDLEDETDLVRRLIEYQRYKEVSIDLAARFEERLRHYDKPIDSSLMRDLKEKANASIQYDQSPYDLMNAMQKVLTRYRLAHPYDVSLQIAELSVDDVLDDLRIRFKRIRKISLDDLLMQSSSVQHFLVSFLAVLDMLRMQELLMSIEDDKVYLEGAMQA